MASIRSANSSAPCGSTLWIGPRNRHNLKMRWVYAAIVARFEWRLTRKEWLKALAKAKATGMISYKSADDGGDATIP